ncbi:DUF2812 domain-containing protein [Psychrobacillus sp. NPDC096389]|uniref:DUF2812 domain-containing protein n=1 Tax=Psychrobacillus sp. NPDC096389 TaxID=3364490 RepID=UPI00380A9D78
MIKKWRPFWSYDLEKTESFLSSYALEGKKLVGVNLLSRKFLFEEAEKEEVEYQIIYDASKSKLAGRLEGAGWENSVTQKKWKFVKNSNQAIHMYPSREGVLKRNRIHSLVLSCIAILYGIQLTSFIVAMLSLLFFPEESTFVPSPLWSITILYFLQVIAVIVLTIYMTQKLRAFNVKFFRASIDTLPSVGNTFSKWRFGWMHAPDLLENWLSDMAMQGNRLVRVSKLGSEFVFQKSTPKLVSYVYDYQLKASPNYYDIHKNAGWKLVFTSSSWFAKYSIWQKEYEIGEEQPRFTYDSAEKKRQVRKVMLVNASFVGYLLVILSYAWWINLSNFYVNERSTVDQVFLGMLLLSSLIPISIIFKIVKYALRVRNI